MYKTISSIVNATVYGNASADAPLSNAIHCYVLNTNNRMSNRVLALRTLSTNVMGLPEDISARSVQEYCANT